MSYTTGTANQTLSWTIPTPSGTQAAVGGFNIYRGATKITATHYQPQPIVIL